MGVDIHFFVETRPKDTEPWQVLPAPHHLAWSDKSDPTPAEHRSWEIRRNYELFSVLSAGTRGSLKPIAEPRGWPEDITPAAEKWLSLVCSHGRSHLYLYELQNYPWDDKVTLGKETTTPRDVCRHFCKRVMPVLVRAGKDVGWMNLRCVFGYDF